MGKNHQQVRFEVLHSAGLDLCLLLFKMSSDKARKQIPVCNYSKLHFWAGEIVQ